MKKRIAACCVALSITIIGCGGGETPAPAPKVETDAPAVKETPAPAKSAAVAGMDEVLALALTEADHLASDTFDAATAKVLADKIAAIPTSDQGPWLKDLAGAANGYAASAGIDAARMAFGTLSGHLIGYAETHESAVAMHKIHCPMAPEGIEGSWLQASDSARNPWYGSGMLTCGSKIW